MYPPDAMPYLPRPSRLRRAGRSYWAAVIFLVGFAILIILISRFYLIPAFEAVKQKAPDDPHARAAWQAMIRATKAWWTLSLAILLLILLSGLLLTFRIGRFFFPRPSPPRTRTKYVDAWAESAKRLQTPAKEDDAADE